MITDTRRAPLFEVAPTIDGFEVVDARTGRPLDTRPTRRSAQGFAFVLNQAAAKSQKALDHALKSG